MLYHLTEGREVLRRYRDLAVSGLPDELIVYAAVIRTPDATPCVAIIPAWCGDDSGQGEHWIGKIGRLGTVLADTT